MKKCKLDNDIINKDLKKARNRIIFIILVCIILIAFGIYDFFKDNSMYVSCFEITFGLVCLIFFIRKEIILKSKYSIKEGFVEHAFYDTLKKQCEINIKDLKGVIISKHKFMVDENVYVVYYKNNALMCYSKDKYYI